MTISVVIAIEFARQNGRAIRAVRHGGQSGGVRAVVVVELVRFGALVHFAAPQLAVEVLDDLLLAHGRAGRRRRRRRRRLVRVTRAAALSPTRVAAVVAAGAGAGAAALTPLAAAATGAAGGAAAAVVVSGRARCEPRVFALAVVTSSVSRIEYELRKEILVFEPPKMVSAHPNVICCTQLRLY